MPSKDNDGPSSFITAIIAFAIAALVGTTDPRGPNADQSKKATPFCDPLVWATIGIFLATAVSVVVAALQLCTLISTDAANKASERASIYMQLVGISPNTSPDQKRRWIFRASVGNAGTTSTTKMTYAFDCVTDPTVLFDKRRLKERETTGYALGPKEVEGSQEACVVSDADVSDYIQSGKHLYVFGQATYRDIFQTESDPEHITEICVDHYEFSRAKNPNLNDPSLIDARSRYCHEGHNCNDRGCASASAR
jgi:hypothetical protein